MFRNLKLDPRSVYLFIEFSASAFFSMMFVTVSLYEATVAGLTPVQLILVGTTLEISAFIFEVPTGIVADVYSRRLSIIIGYLISDPCLRSARSESVAQTPDHLRQQDRGKERQEAFDEKAKAH